MFPAKVNTTCSPLAFSGNLSDKVVHCGKNVISFLVYRDIFLINPGHETEIVVYPQYIVRMTVLRNIRINKEGLIP